MSNTDIVALQRPTTGEKIYPQTHIEGVVGNDTLGYLGDVVGHADDPGGGGVDPKRNTLSVSPRQSIIVGKCIPLHPRKGKKYYFADGIIKVKKVYEDSVYIYSYGYLQDSLTYIGSTPATQEFSIAELYDHFFPAEPALVTITREWQIDDVDLNECGIEYCPNLNSITESPRLEVINGYVRNISAPNLWLYYQYGERYSMPIYRIASQLERDRLRAIKYTTMNNGNENKRLKCYILQPRWIMNKLARYNNNSWVGKHGNTVPCLHYNRHGEPQVRSGYANHSGRVYLYTVCRRRVGINPKVIHFFRGGHASEIQNVFYREKMNTMLDW